MQTEKRETETPIEANSIRDACTEIIEQSRSVRDELEKAGVDDLEEAGRRLREFLASARVQLKDWFELLADRDDLRTVMDARYESLLDFAREEE